jgi:serine/threonine-protein kinase
MTTTGQVIGSPGHMAPEQVEGRELGPQSDLFSLGTVLYLLATGELPFQGRNAPQVLKQIVEGQFVDPQRLRPEMGGRLRAVIMRCLEVDAARRYPDAAALTNDLLAFVHEMGIEQPAEALADYLHEPEAFTASFRKHAIERLIELGEDARKRRAWPEALDHFNRVLAMDAGNARVLAAVQRIGRHSRLRRTALIGAAVTVAVAAVGLLAYQRAAPTPAPSPAVQVRVPPAAAAPEPPTPEPALTPDDEPKQAPEAKRRPQPTKDRPARAGGPRRVIFRPFPANVSIGINGEKPRPFGPSFREVELEPGEHDFKFVGAHDCCVDAEFKVRIPPGDEPLTISRRLAFRPAGLYVVSDVPANVIVDGGKVSGRTRNVINVVGLENMVETHTIRVTAPGVTDHVREVQLTAGRVATVEVALRPGG